MRILLCIAALVVAGCTLQTGNGPSPEPAAPTQQTVPVYPGPKLTQAQAVRNYETVKSRMEPYVERACREMTKNVNCDFKIVVDTRANQPPNAFQTLDDSKRPIIGFNVALLKDVRNADELAFVFGHEAAHHIRGHIAKQQSSAVAGNVLGGLLATVLGGDPNAISTAQELGTFIGARGYSKKHELEADELGAILTEGAGYDAIRGAAYFLRIPDPGDVFLGTHPPNTDRINTVRNAVGR